MNVINRFVCFSVVCCWQLTAFWVQAEDVRPIDYTRQLEENQVVEGGEKYEATFKGDGFQIVSRDKTQTFHVQSLPPVYVAKWTRDSQTLCTVEHLAGGSNAACFHYDPERHTWFRMNFKPAGGPYLSYQISNWDIGETDVQVTYLTHVKGGTAPATTSLKVDKPLFVAFAAKLAPQVQLNRSHLAWTLASTNAAHLQNAAPFAAGPISRNGILAIDTDGTTNDHHDIPANHQDFCSAMKDANGKLVPRKTVHGHLPAGCTDLSADHFSYAVAPSDFAEVNGGKLKVGDMVDVTLDVGGHDHIQVPLADFGPEGKNGEVSCLAITDIHCTIRDRANDGPIPLHNGSDADIPVKVVYHPSP